MTGLVESINVGRVRTDLDTRAPGGRTGIDKRPVDGPVRVTATGVQGDEVCDTKHHGGPDQAVYAYAAEDLAFWADELGQEVRPGGLGENLTVSGIDCTGAVLGERWQVGHVVLQVRATRMPCRVFAQFRGVPDLVKRFIAAGRPGVYFAVLTPGPVRAGDAVTVLDRPDHGVTVADLMAASTVARERAPDVAAARAYLGAREQVWLDRTLAVLAAGRTTAE
ncbi:MAG: MOSC domain-containing protein [Pseudonocardia sp.]